jgi:hypothetical protein
MVFFYIERISFRLVEKSERIAPISDPYPAQLRSHPADFSTIRLVSIVAAIRILVENNPTGITLDSSFVE